MSASTSLAEVAVALLQAAGKSNDGLGSSDESKEQVKSWLDKIGAGNYESEQDVKVSSALLLPPCSLLYSAVLYSGG